MYVTYNIYIYIIMHYFTIIKDIYYIYLYLLYTTYMH